MFKSILLKLGILFLMMDTFIRRPFHLENLLNLTHEKMILRPTLEAGFHAANCPGHPAIIIAPYFWLLFCYVIAFVILSIALMIHDTKIKRWGDKRRNVLAEQLNIF